MNEQIPQQPPAPLTPEEECQWAMFAHLGVLANLISGFLGPLVPLAIYMIYKNRSRYVAYQSLQGLIFQLTWWVGGGVLYGITWAITDTLSAFIISLISIWIAIFIAFIYGVYAGLECNRGADFKYWLIGDWVRSTLTN